MKNKIRLKIIASVMLTLFLLAGATAAWFFANNDVEVDYGSTIQCEAGNSLEISLDGGKTWHSSVSFNSDVSPKIVDISGNGVNLYKPTVITELGQPQSFVHAQEIDAEGNGDYIEMQVMLRSASVMNVYFSGDSFVQPNSTSTENLNIYGNFSKDYIAGAVRVAVIENVGGVDELKMLWAPNPTYELSYRNGVYSFVPNGKGEDSYSYYTANGSDLNNMQLHTVTTEQYLKKQFVIGSTGGDITTSGNSPVLTVLDTKINPEDSVYTKTITIRVWFEGTDREASQALSGGWANMLFKFNGMQKSPAEASKQAEIDSLVYFNGSLNGLKNGMAYSIDGKTWTVYSTGDTIDYSKASTFYFKYPETDTNYETNYTTVTIG